MKEDVSCITILGCKIKKEKLYEKKETPPCDHEIPLNYNFCPVCGVSNSPNEEYIPVLNFDEEYKVSGFDFIRPDVEDDFFIVGKTLGNTGRNDDINFCRLSKTIIADLKQDIMIFLKQINLWDEKTFGLYTIKE